MYLKRREFIALLGTAAVWPLAARAQQPTPVVGFLHASSPHAFARQAAAFRAALAEGGYVDGKNAKLEYRWAEDHPERLPALALDLVNRQVSVIAALGGNNPTLAARAATTSIPIVFNTGADPVQSGLVSSLNRPDGNITGVSFRIEELGTKTLGLLHELVPKVTLIGVLVNPSNQAAEHELVSMQAAARTLGLQLQIVRAASAEDIDRAFPVFVDQGAGALMVMADPLYSSRTNQLVELAAAHRLPTAHYRRDFTEAGGLMSYGASSLEAYRQVGAYVARILSGAKPAALPVVQVARFEFVLNLDTAKQLGLEVPAGMAARADDVIE